MKETIFIKCYRGKAFDDSVTNAAQSVLCGSDISMRAMRSIDMNAPAKPISDVRASTKSITPYVRLEKMKISF